MGEFKPVLVVFGRPVDDPPRRIDFGVELIVWLGVGANDTDEDAGFIELLPSPGEREDKLGKGVKVLEDATDGAEV